MEICEFAEAMDAKTCPDRFELLVVFEGRGRISWRSESMPYTRGEAWMLPAALGKYHLDAQSRTKLLRTYVPDLEQVSRELEGQGFSESQRSAVLLR
jgi:mannose-6-phosphate isomerase class I